MSLTVLDGHSDIITNQPSRKAIGRATVNYHPSVWNDHFLSASLSDMDLDANAKQRLGELKEEVKKILLVMGDSLLKLNFINEIERLGVAYHFEMDIDKALRQIHDDQIGGREDCGDDLHAVALRFRLLRQHGYNVSSDVFKKFKDNEGNFKDMLSGDTRGLLSLYEASFVGTNEDGILDEAIIFTTEHLKLALPHLKPHLSKLVEFALELPLHKIIERLQARLYISIYEEDEQRNDVLLELAKLDFNILQSLHQKEIRDITKWWKEVDLPTKLPFIRDRIVECYFWMMGIFFEPQYSLGRRIATTMTKMASVLDDFYDVHGTLEELELYTAALERWDRGVMDELPDYMKVHFGALLDIVQVFEDELATEGKAYRVYYIKEAFKLLAKGYLAEARWLSLGYVPTYEEYINNALVSGGYPMILVSSLAGMGEEVTKEVFDWALNIAPIIRYCSMMARIEDDIQSHKFEQERDHVPSAIECYMKEHGISEEEASKKMREMIAIYWKGINKEHLESTFIPMVVNARVLNLARAAEFIYLHKDGYTISNRETKEAIKKVLVDPIFL